jgi:hypothetical protein
VRLVAIGSEARVYKVEVLYSEDRAEDVAEYMRTIDVGSRVGFTEWKARIVRMETRL